MPCKKCDEGKYKWGETGECEYDTLQDCESANHKYNKMQPTPLGKKSYEEYEKELKEFNLSKVERVELGAIDDLKKKLDKNISNFDKEESNISSLRGAFVGIRSIFVKISDEASLIRKQVSDLGIDDPKDLGFISLKSKELEKLCGDFVKKLKI
jgi:hypothetical protein